MKSLCRLSVMLLWAAAALAEPVILTPAVADRTQNPVEEIDLRGITTEQLAELSAKLTTRIYGPENPYRNYLRFRVTSSGEGVFAVEVDKAARGGAELAISIDQQSWSQKWPAAAATHEVQTIYSVTVPAGDKIVRLAARSGTLVLKRILWLPATADQAGLKLVPLAEGVPASQANVGGGTRVEGVAVPVMPTDAESKTLDGYRLIWFNLGQEVPVYGPKYSGGLGTYTAKHRPMAIYSAAANKTFFTYGGNGPNNDLVIMASYFDHARNSVPRPTQVMHWLNYNDPHCNAALSLDGQGYVWIFVSGRGRNRAGYKFKSVEPYSTAKFEQVFVGEMCYPQPWYIPGRGFLHLFTKYTKGRELYWETSDPTGETWSETRKFAGFGGHYEITGMRDGRVVAAFNYHKNGNVDTRTNIYFVQSADFGQTWTTITGEPLTMPLEAVQNPALVRDYEAEKKLCYIKDINFDEAGRPVILAVVSNGFQAGPTGDPREWTLVRWTGSEWRYSVICRSDHNYDTGSLYIEGDRWRVYAPTTDGPQLWGAGGEIDLWETTDRGETWRKVKPITSGSALNNNYVRRPVDAKDPFYAYWADGNPYQRTPSRLYFTDRDGSAVWVLPDQMTEDFPPLEKVAR